LGDPAAARPERLEDAVTQLEAAVEHGHVRRIGGQDAPLPPHEPRQRVAHPGASTAPIEDSGPRALATVSSHSSSGSLRQVMPPPTWRVSRSPSATNVRIRMLDPILPSAPTHSTVPQYGPRLTGSRRSISSIARIFGAPVMLPPGNAAAR